MVRKCVEVQHRGWLRPPLGWFWPLNFLQKHDGTLLATWQMRPAITNPHPQINNWATSCHIKVATFGCNQIATCISNNLMALFEKGVRSVVGRLHKWSECLQTFPSGLEVPFGDCYAVAVRNLPALLLYSSTNMLKWGHITCFIHPILNLST